MYTSSITINEVIKVLGDFLQPFMPEGAAVVRGQVNRVPLPTNPCAVLTEMLQTDLSVPATTFAPPTGEEDDGTVDIYGPKRIDVQIDFYGTVAGELCSTVKTAFRSYWGFEHFPPYIKPLYTSDGMQSPLITGEQQFDSRWTLTVSIQYNPTVTVPQDSAIELTVTDHLADS